MNVIWSEEAKTSYRQIIIDLFDMWSAQVAEKLEDSVNKFIHKLQFHNHICPPSKLKESYRKCVVSKQTSLIYQIENDTITLIAFIDNRSNHKY
ncbi:type II toxin-antitoxin system RelE/ParE family toxin [Parvicella tangerina]|uniref:Type II toxin-antitoxin system RelE/ParE family toxin n=1 Tax=Parvicella tangerina TaxID=2829795 RepID=A0A916JL99_9FLAO|nr:type II toxin-antitoxin system RelE/ParE family toxin [Parvicella tangerina]CAG5078961.1 hypothetical protein CRYO30217_00819 [Parvicella tangerina]